METGSIKQVATFDAAPEVIYNLLMDAKKHAAFTGSKVTMNNEVKGKFDVFDGYCHGYNIELIKGKKIVQAWHFAEDGWPDDHFSICTFLLENDGGRTKLYFSQTGIPAHKVESLKDGWKQFYWKNIKDYLKKG